MTVSVLLVADDLAAQLGSPTIEALSARWSSGSPCEICGESIGDYPVSIIGRSALGSAERIHLRPAHSHCSPSKWIKDAAHDELSRQPVRAELVVILLASGVTMGCLDASVRRPLVVLAINPSVSAARYRVVRPGEAIDLDMLGLVNSGWTALDETTLGDPTSPLLVTDLGHDSMTVSVADALAWQVPISPDLERAVRLRSGLLVALGHRPCVTEISKAGPTAGELIVPALEHGDFLSGWARLVE